MRWFSRRKRLAATNAVKRQVDRLTFGLPDELTVEIATLPDKDEEILDLYVGLFREQGYTLGELVAGRDDLWEARFRLKA